MQAWRLLRPSDTPPLSRGGPLSLREGAGSEAPSHRVRRRVSVERAWGIGGAGSTTEQRRHCKPDHRRRPAVHRRAYDTTEATTGPTDPGFCFDPSIGPDRSTVWYSFTPDASDLYLADTFGSDYDTTLYVGTLNEVGGIDVIACVDDSGGLQSAVSWDATAGTTYLIAVGTCCGFGLVGEPGGGGSLVLHVDVAPPPPTVNLTIDPTGGFTQDGASVITGTIECSPGVLFVAVELEVVQRAGRFTTTGFGGTFLSECSSPWTVSAFSGDGLFRGGKVAVTAFAFACDPLQCTDDVESRSVRLSGVGLAVSPPVGPPPVGPRPCPGAGGHPGGPGPVSPPMKPPAVSKPMGPPGASRRFRDQLPLRRVTAPRSLELCGSTHCW